MPGKQESGSQGITGGMIQVLKASWCSDPREGLEKAFRRAKEKKENISKQQPRPALGLVATLQEGAVENQESK